MSDIFRKEYVVLSSDQQEAISEVKEIAATLWRRFDFHGVFSGRELAIAKTNLEQAVMWAVKGITERKHED